MDYNFDVLDISTSETDLFCKDHEHYNESNVVVVVFFLMQDYICKAFSFIAVSCCELLLNNEYG